MRICRLADEAGDAFPENRGRVAIRNDDRNGRLSPGAPAGYKTDLLEVSRSNGVRAGVRYRHVLVLPMVEATGKPAKARLRPREAQEQLPFLVRGSVEERARRLNG